MTPSLASLESLLSGCGIRLDRTQLDQLWQYHRLLRSANADLNMTRIHNFENMVLKHYVDSLLVLKYVDLPAPLVDMGSGPGLPGIPLKIARPDLPMILAEPRGARAEFLEQVRDQLGLANLEVFAGKVNRKFPHRVRGVITRAVASIPETLTRVAGCLEPGGRMIFMKGPDCDAEIAEARVSHAESFRFEADHHFTIPGTPHARRVVVYERLAGAAPDDEDPAPAYGGHIREVASAANPTFKLASDLLNGRGIRKHGQALLAGARINAEVIAQAPDRIVGYLSDSKGEAPPASDPPIPWYRLGDGLFRELDVSGTRAPLLLVRVPEFAEWSADAPWPEGCTLFVPFQDPENIGAVVRSASAFGVSRVVLLKEAAHPFHPKSARAAGPALFQVEFQQGPSIRDLRSDAVPLIALSGEGADLASAPFPERFGLVAGVEGPGLPDHLRHGLTRRIAIRAEVESLNAATAAAIALFAWRSSC